jgi:dTMP kinase
MTRGRLVAFEGLDQSGKQTQALRLRQALEASGVSVVSFDFPDYTTPIGREIGAALGRQRTFPPDCLQLLYVANRCEHRPAIESALAAGQWVVCDRYLASSIAYGEAQGLDPAWLSEIQQYLPPATLTVLLDIAPETAVQRKTTGRDRYERDLSLLARVRESYRRQAQQADWVLINGELPKNEVRDAVEAAVLPRLKR